MKRKLITFIIAVVTLSALLCGNAFAIQESWLGHTVTYNLAYTTSSATASLSFNGVPCYIFTDCKYYFYDGDEVYYVYGSDEAPNGGPIYASTRIPTGTYPVFIRAKYNVSHDSQAFTRNLGVDF